MIRRSTWSPTTLLVLATVLSILQLGEAGRSSIRVTEIARVLRGRSVDFRNNFLLPQNFSTSSNCTVYHLASGGLCGAVQPPIFPCSYDGPVIFQHLGCYSAYETINLELVISKNSRDIAAGMFSIPITVEDSDEEKPMVSLDRSTGTLSVAFMLATGCTYTVVHDHSSLRLPLHGELSGESLGQPIPCGLSPRTQLAYMSRLNETQASDAVLVRVDRYNQQHLSNSSYYVLSLKTPPLPVVQLPNANMDVFELSETVISPSLLPLDQLNSYTFTDLNAVFPVLKIGSLYPIATVNRGAMDAISFNAAQLQDQKVVFRPNETLTTMSKETFNYHVTDTVGRTVAKGVLQVNLHPRTGRTPSIRKNTGLAVKHGERTVLGPPHLSFYAMSSCANATLRLVNDSSFGSFLFANGTSVKVNEKIPASLINNGSLLYEHNAGIHRAILLDFSLWRLECSHQPTLLIPLLITLLPTPSLCHKERHNTSSVMAPSSIAVPLPIFLTKQVENSSIMVSASSGLLFQSNCFQTTLSNHSRFPFIHSTDLNLTACSPTSALKMRGNQASTVWFLPLHQSTIITTNLRTNRVCSIRELNIKLLNLTLEELFVHQKPDIPLSSLLLPTLINKNPLPLTSYDSVIITKQFLYIEPQGLLENKILFHLRTAPRHGHLCSIYMLQCTSSIPAFSQADIINKYIYYKPMNSILMNDSFEFTYSTYDIENSSLPINFTIFVPTKDLSYSPYRQFWAPFLGSKPLAPKFLRHIIQQLKGNDIQFTVTSNPKHGWLQVPTPGSLSFHLRDSTDRNVVYHHNGTGECTDYITLTATGNGRTLTFNLTIAIRRNTKVHETLMGTKLLQDSDSFVLRQEHMNIQESFCPEYVMLEVVQLPGYGILSYIDNKYKVTRLLQDNAMFSAADIKHGLVSYSLVPELIIRDNTTDAFQMKVTEPGQRVLKGDIPRSASNVLSFDVIILPPEGSGGERTVNFTVNSPKWLVQLDNGRYGTIFNQNDFHEWNSEMQPYDIKIIVRQHPTHGTLKRRNNPVGEFTLEQVYEGLIRYESKLSHEDLSVTSDEFRFTVLFGSQQLTIVKTFSLNWCYFNITKYKSFLEESAEIAKFTIRRIGQTPCQPTYVNFTTVPVSENNTAIGQSDCTTNAAITGDFCSVNKRLDFSSRLKQTLSVRIYNDTIAEGPEQFSIKLTNPEGCLLPRQQPKLVWITDFEDYSTISFSIPQDRPANSRISRDICKIEVPTKETVGVLNLNLTRAGNLNKTVGVICYTNTTLNNQARSPDFISRPNNASSMVYFKPGERHAKCPVVIVDDILNEPTDSFFVHLGQMDGFAFIDYSSTPVCVIITHDERDLPLVQFTTTRITVQERKDKIVLAPFNISRTGADLNSITTVILEAQAPAPDNATAGLDFFAGPMNEIEFNQGETTKTGIVRIHPDNIQEGKEVFHIHIKDNNNGRRGSPAVLEVVILDAFEDTVISFLSPNITFAESDGFIHIPFNRSGYKAVTSNITCVLTGGTALPHKDYYLSLPSQLVTLAPGVSKGACDVLLKNDMVKEEEEYFSVTLHTNDLGVRLVTSKATVFITDIEDVPLVSFAQTEYIVEEPLSNYPVDHRQFTITLTRAGDTNIPISVIMSTRPGAASEGIDYIAVNTTLHFPAGVNTVNTTAMRVLANHKKQFNTEFYAVLKPTEESESQVRLGNKGEARIVIKHWVLKGVFFPGLPMIASSNYSNNLNNITFGTLLSHDNPLMCITPCDVQYPTSQIYLKECTRQRIDRFKTQFKWEISTDGDRFTELHQDTFLTSTHRQLLDPVYLTGGLFVRCTATAIDSNSVSGYSRVSHSIKLTMKRQYPYQPGGTTAAFSSYNGFQWRSQDLVMLTINLPHLPNTIPLVTSKHFALNDFTTFLTYPASRMHHTCSSFLLTPSTASQHSLLSHTNDSADKEQTLYQHYDQTNCQWTFKTWISLAAVQQQCGAVLTGNNLVISLEVLYFSIYNNTAVIENTTNTTAIFNHPRLNNSHKIFPYVYRPIQPINDIHVKLISLQHESGQNSYSAIVYSYSSINRMIHSGILINSGIRRSATINNMRLMYSDHQHGTQSWVLNIAAGSTNKTEIMFNLLPCVHYSWSPGCNPGPPITFRIPLMLTSGTQSAVSRARTAVDTTIIRQQQTILVRLKLKATQRLQANYTLIITRAWLCSSDISSTVGGGCLDSNQTKKSFDIMNDLHAQLSSNSTHMEVLLSVDSLKQAGESDGWYMDIRYGVAQEGQLVDNEDQVVLSVTLDQPQAHSTSAAVLLLPTQFPPLGTSQTIPVYAIVLLSLAFGLLIVVCGITACFVCYSSRQRLLHKRKTNRPHNDDDESSTSKVSNPSTARPTMTNTHSRKIRRSKSSVQLLMQKAAEISRQNQTTNSAHNKPATSKSSLKRSSSLPDLATLRKCPTSNSTTAPSYILPTRITSRSKAKVATVRPISRVCPPSKPPATPPSSTSCKVTDKSLDVRLENWRKAHPCQPVSSSAGWYERHKSRQVALASYAQLYLAAGARTPEPGISPSTKL